MSSHLEWNMCLCEDVAFEEKEAVISNSLRKKTSKNQLLIQTNILVNQCDQPKYYKTLINKVIEDQLKETVSTKDTLNNMKKGKVSISNQKKVMNTEMEKEKQMKKSGLSSQSQPKTSKKFM